jgi:hypothetical protein
MRICERRCLVVERLHAPLELFFKCAYVRRQQAVQGKDITFVIGEGSAFVEPRSIDQIVP